MHYVYLYVPVWFKRIQKARLLGKKQKLLWKWDSKCLDIFDSSPFLGEKTPFYPPPQTKNKIKKNHHFFSLSTPPAPVASQYNTRAPCYVSASLRCAARRCPPPRHRRNAAPELAPKGCHAKCAPDATPVTRWCRRGGVVWATHVWINHCGLFWIILDSFV